MKDKEKQIEEMAKEIFNTCVWRFGKPNDYKEIFNDIAEDLTKLNYRKIDKNSVVLSKEEYQELKQSKTLLELREETIKYLEDANIRYHETLTDVFNRWVETDKETGGFNLCYIYDLAHFYEIEIKQ